MGRSTVSPQHADLAHLRAAQRGQGHAQKNIIFTSIYYFSIEKKFENERKNITSQYEIRFASLHKRSDLQCMYMGAASPRAYIHLSTRKTFS
ncbi:MAG: hypothetical protein NZ455_02180 [Bacteroidia bacterium]|nr:hypothetical protein [Bacteroidia bacterium]